MGLPILRLPFLALKVIVDHFNRVELVTVSLLSKRADRFLKACGKKNISFFNLPAEEIKGLREIQIFKLFLSESRRQGKLPKWNFELSCSVTYDEHITISCRNFSIPICFENLENIEDFVETRRHLKMGESLVPVVVTEDYRGVEMIRTFWSRQTDGMMTFMDYLKNNFNLSIQELEFRSNDSTAVRTVAHHMNSTQTNVRKVEVGYFSRFSGYDLKCILENVTATDCFTSFSKVDHNFKFNGTIHAKKIYIRNGDWFTIQSLLKSNKSEKIYVDKSDFKTGDLRTFLKEWTSGKFPKLKKVELITKATCRNYLDVTKGFEKREDKCDYSSRRRPVVAIKGQRGFYGIVNPNENRYGRFHMSVHKG